MKRDAIDVQLAELAARYLLGEGAVASLGRLLDGLAAEPAPPTTVRAPADAIRVHVADSLVGLEVEAVRNAGRLVDLGTGAGFPGLPLAAALPAASFDLVEATRRKAAVVERLAARAGLGNARVLPLRAEELAAKASFRETYDVVTARALARLPVLAEYAAPLLCVGGSLVAWKGAAGEAEELAGARASEILGLVANAPRPVSPYAGSRALNLYVYSKVMETPERFPRRPGIALKRPLA